MVLDPVAASAPSILAAIVCYEPDREALSGLVDQLTQNVGVRVLLVDNSESEAGRVSTAAVAAGYGVAVIANTINLGVATAHNIGILRALDLHVDYVLLLDQDSELGEGAVERLAGAHRALAAAGQRVAAVGPSFSDPRCNSHFPFARLRHFRMESVAPGPGQAVECDILISSGCLISTEALRQLGGMDDRLFIDFVDVEWCLRARSAGWKVFGVADARMHHTIGDRAIKVLGRVIPVHNPVRNYYLIRNALLFARKPYLTWRWRVHLAYRVVGQFALFGLLCPQRLQRLGWMLRGLFDGALGRDGRLGGVKGLGRPTRERRGAAAPALPQVDEAVHTAVVPLRD